MVTENSHRRKRVVDRIVARQFTRIIARPRLDGAVCLFILCRTNLVSGRYKCRNKRKGDEKRKGKEGAGDTTMRFLRRIHNRREHGEATERIERE